MFRAPPPSRTPSARVREHLPAVVCVTVLLALSVAGYAIGERTGAALEERLASGLLELHATTADRIVLSRAAFARLVLLQNASVRV
jgi:hypothetical protein